jgi:hypothetical protein
MTTDEWFERLQKEGAAETMAELGAEEPADLLDLEADDIAAIAVALALDVEVLLTPPCVLFSFVVL